MEELQSLVLERRQYDVHSLLRQIVLDYAKDNRAKLPAGANRTEIQVVDLSAFLRRIIIEYLKANPPIS